MSALIYIRVSTEDQKLGPKAQQDACEAFCNREGIEVSGVFVDHGVSGGAPLDKRDALIDAINELNEGDIIVVAKRCRLARDVLISSVIEKSVSDKGGKIFSADGIGQGDSPESVMMKQILDVFAQYERSVIRMRTRAALRQLKKKGKRTGEIPFGFKVDDQNNLLPNKLEMLVISEVMRLHGLGISMRAIARQLKADGMRGRKGSLTHVQVGRIIKSQKQKSMESAA